MIRDPEIREAAERLAAEWAKTLETVAFASEVHAVEYALNMLIGPDPVYRELICRRCWAPRIGEVYRAGPHELPAD